MWKKTVQPDRPQMTMSYGACAFAYWIPKATNTHSEYVIVIAFPLRQWLQERASILTLVTSPLLFYIRKNFSNFTTNIR